MELSIVLTNDDEIRKLNKNYRSLNAPTDVLAFAMRDGEGGDLHRDLLGDIVVSVETARFQARRARRRVLSEVTMLIVHGLLHLLGWDHETRTKDARMRAETSRLCRVAARRSPPSVYQGPRSASAKRNEAQPTRKGHTHREPPLCPLHPKGSRRAKNPRQ